MAMKKRFYSVNGQMMGYESSGVKKDFLTDHLGSITAEIDQTQTRTYDTRYSAYGRNNWSTGTGCGFGWVGSYGYRETGLFHMSHYVRARHYSYVTGAWSTVDPLWPREASYGYVGGKCTWSVDPTGLQGINPLCLGFACESWPGGPCKYAEEVMERSITTIGYTFCCNGKVHACVFENRIPKDKLIPGVRHCIQVHENDHARHKKCPFMGANDGTPDPGYGNPRGECFAHMASFKCFVEQWLHCSKLINQAEKARCLEVMAWWLKKECGILKLYCKSVPSECDLFRS